jgi:hypothetical protein
MGVRSGRNKKSGGSGMKTRTGMMLLTATGTGIGSASGEILRGWSGGVADGKYRSFASRKMTNKCKSNGTGWV